MPLPLLLESRGGRPSAVGRRPLGIVTIPLRIWLLPRRPRTIYSTSMKTLKLALGMAVVSLVGIGIVAARPPPRSSGARKGYKKAGVCDRLTDSSAC